LGHNLFLVAEQSSEAFERKRQRCALIPKLEGQTATSKRLLPSDRCAPMFSLFRSTSSAISLAQFHHFSVFLCFSTEGERASSCAVTRSFF
jgi:hypothetical protein